MQSFDYRGAHTDSVPGLAIVLHPDEPHDGHAGIELGFRYRMLYLEPRLVRDALGARARSLPFVRAAVLPDAPLMRALQLAFADMDHAWEALERDQIVLALADALLALDPSARGSNTQVSACAIAVERARQYLDAHYTRVVASDELEAVSGLDRYALARHFRARLGTSPYRYLTMRRLDRVRARLRAGDGLADAAADCGFADQSHMTRQFKRAYGVAPGQWQRLLSWQSGGGPYPG